MPNRQINKLLIAGSAILMLSACGKDDDPTCTITGQSVVNGACACKDGEVVVDKPGQHGGTTQVCEAPNLPPNVWELPEGGEVRVIATQFHDGNPVQVDLNALFFRNQMPASRALGGAVIEGACEDWSAGNIFDNGITPEAEAIVASREYIDMGASVVVKQGSNTLTAPKFTDDFDLANFLTHPIVYKNSNNADLGGNLDASALTFNANFDVELDGLTDGEDPLGNKHSGTPQIFVPAAFDLVAPAFTDEGTANAILNVTAGQAVEFQYGTSPSASPRDITFIAFIDAETGAVNGQCLNGIEAANNGAYTVPAQMIDRMNTALGGHQGLILLGTFVHRAFRTDSDGTADQPGRRLDLLGIYCHLFPWAVQ